MNTALFGLLHVGAWALTQGNGIMLQAYNRPIKVSDHEFLLIGPSWTLSHSYYRSAGGGVESYSM